MRASLRRYMFSALAVAGFLRLGTPCLAADHDIVGLRVGMSPAQATDALKAYDPSISLDEETAKLLLENAEPFVSSIQGTVGQPIRPTEFLEVRFSMPPGDVRSLMAGRYQTFEKGAEIDTAKTREALVGKYGQPTYEKQDKIFKHVLLAWSDREIKDRDVYTCADYLMQTSMPVGNFSFPQKPELKCGSILVVKLFPDSNNPSVTRFMTSAFIDHRAWQESEAATAAYVDQQKKLAEENRAKDAAGRTPRL